MLTGCVCKSDLIRWNEASSSKHVGSLTAVERGERKQVGGDVQQGTRTRAHASSPFNILF